MNSTTTPSLLEVRQHCLLDPMLDGRPENTGSVMNAVGDLISVMFDFGSNPLRELRASMPKLQWEYHRIPETLRAAEEYLAHCVHNWDYLWLARPNCTWRDGIVTAQRKTVPHDFHIHWCHWTHAVDVMCPSQFWDLRTISSAKGRLIRWHPRNMVMAKIYTINEKHEPREIVD